MPCLWSAWLELAPMLDHKERALVLIDRIQDHWMKNFLMASFHLDVHQEREAINLSSNLLSKFPTSVYLKNQIAHASYQAHEYDKSIEQF